MNHHHAPRTGTRPCVALLALLSLATAAPAQAAPHPCQAEKLFLNKWNTEVIKKLRAGNPTAAQYSAVYEPYRKRYVARYNLIHSLRDPKACVEPTRGWCEELKRDFGIVCNY
jgi:hypothetical protein